jgi:pimeloyl-ACP methyl ester carboxylesterase
MNGLQMHDSGDGPALVLLHAFPCDGRMWEPQAAAALAEGWRVLVPDLPGFGGSPLPTEPPSIDHVADVLVGELERRGIERCVVGGVSLGGYVTMAVLRRHPERVAAAFLCDTKATADSEAARENRERLAQLCLDTPSDTARILEQVRGWLGEANADAVAWYQRAMADRPDSRPALASAGPLVIVWGQEDALSSRAEQDLMLEAAPDAALIVVPGAGHLANVEDPEAVSAALRRLLTVARGPQQD